jgi:hypothetical protein
VMASLVPALAMGREHGYTAAAATIEIAAVSSAGSCPNTVIVVGTVVLSVGYTPCGTL